MKNIRRFTLVELLAVMALIAILSGIGFGVYSYAKNKAKESATEALLKQIEAGLDGFHTKAGYYPLSQNQDFSTIRFRLAADGTVEGVIFGVGNHDNPQNDEPDGETLTRDTGADKASRTRTERLEAFVKSLDMEVIKNHLNSNNEIVDAWGNPIYYRSPGRFRTGGYDLVSAGSDANFGSSAGNKTPKGMTDPAKFRKSSGEHVCDDIFNF